MAIKEDPGLVAEVHCLNCARVLAQAVRRAHKATVEIRPADHRTHVQVIVAGPHQLQCGHCGGRAYLDVFREPVERRGALRSLVG
jgi:hypothetical protein